MNSEGNFPLPNPAAEVARELNELRQMVIESPTNRELLKRIDDSEWIMPIDSVELVALADEAMATRRMKGIG